MATVILAEKLDQAEKFAFALADKKIPKSGVDILAPYRNFEWSEYRQ